MAGLSNLLFVRSAQKSATLDPMSPKRHSPRNYLSLLTGKHDKETLSALAQMFNHKFDLLMSAHSTRAGSSSLLEAAIMDYCCLATVANSVARRQITSLRILPEDEIFIRGVVLKLNSQSIKLRAEAKGLLAGDSKVAAFKVHHALFRDALKQVSWVIDR